MMRRVFALGVGLAAAAAPLTARDTYPRQPGVDAEHYVFHITLSDSTNDIGGEATVAIRFTKAGLTHFFLDLTSLAGDNGMTVTGVSEVGVPLRYTHLHDRLTITMARPSKALELRRFTVRYHGVPGDGLRIGTNKYGERCFFSWNWPDKARQWLPTIDHPSDKATSEFIVTAPDVYSVVANGLLQSEVATGDGRKVTHWSESVPIASWLNAIGVERFAVHHAGLVRGVELQTWMAHQDLAAGEARFEDVARRAIEFYSDYVGPYSYEKMASVAAPFNGGATEHASEVFYGDGGTRAPGTTEAVAGATAGRAAGAGAAAGGRGGRGGTSGRGGRAGRGAQGPPPTGGAGGAGGTPAHEIAHQWFGDAVAESDWDDAWLSEGFATYFTLLYNEHYAGHDLFMFGVRSMFRAAHTAQQSSAEPVIHRNIDDLRGVIPQLVYQKGGAFLHMLRGQIGTANFWAGIRDYYRRHRNGNASTADLQRSMEEASGQQLGWFFDQWLKRTTDPFLEGTWSYDAAGKKVVLVLTQTQAGAPFRLPLEVAVASDGAAPPRVERIELSKRTQHFEIALDTPPADIVLDPNSWILMEPPRLKRK